MGYQRRVHGQSNLKDFPNMKVFIALSALIGLGAARESYHGSGEMKCYGDMSVSLFKDNTNGFLDCRPSWGSPSAPPQGIIADGDDGTHWVMVDDKGSGDCLGDITYFYGDLGLGYCNRLMLDDGHQTRLFCGYATCTGEMNLECTMLSGCHG